MADLADRLLEISRLVMEVPPREAQVALAQVAALTLLLSVRAAELDSEEASPTQTVESVWMNPAQVEQIYGLSLAWLLEHARALEQAGLVSKVSRKMKLYHRAKLGRWIAARQAAPDGA
jgi:hypothetical protein